MYNAPTQIAGNLPYGIKDNTQTKTFTKHHIQPKRKTQPEHHDTWNQIQIKTTSNPDGTQNADYDSYLMFNNPG